MRTLISSDTVESIRSAAKKLTSHKRREYQAEMALKYCNGSRAVDLLVNPSVMMSRWAIKSTDRSPRVAGNVFGWRRTTVATG